VGCGGKNKRKCRGIERHDGSRGGKTNGGERNLVEKARGGVGGEAGGEVMRWEGAKREEWEKTEVKRNGCWVERRGRV